jgi:hypothetical protein
MKKTYMKPVVEVIRIQTQGMIATSSPGIGGTTDKTSDLLSRDCDDWDED